MLVLFYAEVLRPSYFLHFRPVDEDRLRPVTQLDLLFGLDKMKESKQATAATLPVVAEVPLD